MSSLLHEVKDYRNDWAHKQLESVDIRSASRFIDTLDLIQGMVKIDGFNGQAISKHRQESLSSLCFRESIFPSPSDDKSTYSKWKCPLSASVVSVLDQIKISDPARFNSSSCTIMTALLNRKINPDKHLIEALQRAKLYKPS